MAPPIHPLRYKYIISKYADPVFAIIIGASASWTRIRREEKERGFSVDDTLVRLRRRVRKYVLREAK
ncbi:MAG: hypothetical protein M1834_001812 [Cirrosporium novae-zelandiae]|nr:MAG: hypothetical protein M1834_001812 [Cirrosporium novae-zelandiae]